MINRTKLPEELVDICCETKWHSFGHLVESYALVGIDEIQYLNISPWTSIKMHKNENQWEVWLRISHKTAYVCPKGEEHQLVNNSDAFMIIMSIKGHIDYSYDNLAELFHNFGFSVTHGSLIVQN